MLRPEARGRWNVLQYHLDLRHLDVVFDGRAGCGCHRAVEVHSRLVGSPLHGDSKRPPDHVLLDECQQLLPDETAGIAEIVVGLGQDRGALLHQVADRNATGGFGRLPQHRPVDPAHFLDAFLALLHKLENLRHQGMLARHPESVRIAPLGTEHRHRPQARDIARHLVVGILVQIERIIVHFDFYRVHDLVQQDIEVDHLVLRTAHVAHQPVVAPRASGKSFVQESSSLFIPFNESLHVVALTKVRVGALNQYRFICDQCRRRCRILYLSTLLGCRHCTGARYRSQNESSANRCIRQAYKILATTKLDPTNFQNKKPRRHWKTHGRMLARS